MLCICSPAGREEFFKELGTPVATRTTPPPKVDAAQGAAFIKKIIELCSKVPNRTAQRSEVGPIQGEAPARQ